MVIMDAAVITWKHMLEAWASAQAFGLEGRVVGSVAVIVVVAETSSSS